MRCPDPNCSTPIPYDMCTVTDIAAEQNPWDEDRIEVFHWNALCPGCFRTITAWHGPTDAEWHPPADNEWACSLCGGPVLIRGLKRGPVDAALRCKDGCGALIAIHRRRAAA